MAEVPVRNIYRKDGRRRVVIFRRSVGSFGENTFGFEG
jgi:hypothetical protein